MQAFASLFSLLLAGWFAMATGESYGSVVQLDQNNIHKFLSENETVLLKFYAPWCMHCQSLAPEYEKAAKQLKDEKSSMILAEIDCDSASGIAQDFNIEGYPTIKYFRKGSPRDYTGNRQADGIVSWCKEILLPAVVKIASVRDITDFSAITFVASGYEESDPLYTEFESLADLYRSDAKFYFTTEDAKGIYVTQKDQEKYEFVGTSASELVEFVQNESLPLFGEIGHSNYVRYFGSGKAISWFCSQRVDYDKNRDVFMKVARALRSTVLFVWLDVDKFNAAGEAFDIHTYPAIAHQTQNGRYIMTPESYDFGDYDSVTKFYADVEAGRVPRSIRSEDEPPSNEGPVVTVVGSTLASFVEKATKPILLMVHSPFCEHCKKFMPIFTAFGESMGKEGRVIVASINGDANESSVEHIQWKAYPTVMLLKPGSTEVTLFDGKRTMEELKAFIDDNVGGDDQKTEL